MMATFGFGVRGFIAVVTNRASTIKRISVMQNQAPGTVADKRRRMGTLKRKTIGIVADLAIIFLSNVSVSGSFLVARSFFSSRRAIVNYAVGESLAVLMVLGASMQMHGKVRKVQRQRTQIMRMQTQRLSKMAGGQGTIESQQSGLSVVEQSCVGGGDAGMGTTPGGGLFSEVESKV
jgi:hypothetical protein